MLAGVLDAPPPNRFDVPVLPEPPPKILLLGVLADVPAVPKREGVVPEDELTAPNRGLLGVLLLPLG